MPTAALPASAIPESPLPAYRPDAGVYDEMMDERGQLRPHWRIFGSFLAQCGPADFATRAEAVQRLLRDHGVTYNIYDDALGTSRPWMLDLLPFIVSAQEWATVAEGLDQRARLMNAILADIYGPQHLLKEGWLPPAMVHANPGFLRPVVGVLPAGGRFATRFGCDLVRGPDGAWMALADRVQAPSGHGYTLENRIILANVFAEEFSASRVRRLKSWYDLKRDLLRSLLPQRRGNPGILMLTPGPYNETYFEHAFQARYLGFPLVEGADLTVRDRRLYLKTLEGLRRVDAVLRHVDDVFADPLELNSDSMLGAAGLLEAWRSGSVALANGLGCGVVETPAIHPFLPGLCRKLLGEELKMACVPTWWCGQRRELDLVLAEPDRWVIKPAFVRGARDPIFVRDLDKEQKARLLDSIRAAPHDYVAQEILPLSTTPTLVQGKMEPRALVWRAYAIATGDSFATMPGGLTRVSPEPHRWLVTMRSGGISKDTWVLGDAPSENVRLYPAPVAIRPARPPSGVPSRVADHLFWLGRYSERLEQTVRVLRTTLHRFSGEVSSENNREVAACVALMTQAGLLPSGARDLREHLSALLQDPKRDSSVPDLMGRVRYNAAAARDRLSDDTWRLFNRIERDARMPAKGFSITRAIDLLDTLVLDLAAFSGMEQENMTRGHGWRFLEIGRRIERADAMLSLLHAGTLHAREDEIVLGPLLEIGDSSMSYRRLHFARPMLVQTLDLLLLEPGNPRSVSFQLHALDRLVAKLPQDTTRDTGNREREQTDALLSGLMAFNIEKLAHAGALIFEVAPHFCQKLSKGLETLSDVITEHYFSHAIMRGKQ
ncbi:MAG: circularly permuted type 2 ATP-grasp protein [Verrucomicrobiaceae bacterium]|nr:circularly permuted type 2 ATP-grasp protein [Verrucomicrobiaceae bacterium]